jgi:hypothetical protein
VDKNSATEEDRWALAGIALVLVGGVGALVALLTATDTASKIADTFALVASGGAIPLAMVALVRGQRARIQAEAEKIERDAEFATTKRRANDADTKADALVSKNEELERKLAPRSLSSEQRSELAKRLSVFRETQIVMFWSNETESYTFGREILELIHAAGLRVHAQFGRLGRAMDGVVFEVHGGNRRAFGAAASLAGAIRSPYIRVSEPTFVERSMLEIGPGIIEGAFLPPIPQPDITIMIGSK